MPRRKMRSRRRDTWVPPYRCIPPPKKTTRRPLRGASPACQRTPAFATVSGEIFTFWIGAQNLVGNCCDFDEGICGRGTDSHTSDAGGQSRPPLRTLSLRGAKRRGNPFPFSEGRIPSPVTRSLARNDSASRCSGGQSRPPLQNGTAKTPSPYENDHPFGWSFSTLLCSCQRTSSPTVGLLAA